jgi:hypothetical protein
MVMPHIEDLQLTQQEQQKEDIEKDFVENKFFDKNPKDSKVFDDLFFYILIKTIFLLKPLEL